MIELKIFPQDLSAILMYPQGVGKRSTSNNQVMVLEATITSREDLKFYGHIHIFCEAFKFQDFYRDCLIAFEFTKNPPFIPQWWLFNSVPLNEERTKWDLEVFTEYSCEVLEKAIPWLTVTHDDSKSNLELYLKHLH